MYLEKEVKQRKQAGINPNAPAWIGCITAYLLFRTIIIKKDTTESRVILPKVFRRFRQILVFPKVKLPHVNISHKKTQLLS